MSEPTASTTIELRPVHFLSYSSLETLGSCEREFQLDKEGAGGLRDSNTTFAFGHAMGAGIQHLLAGGTEEEAIWQAFCAWDVGLFEEEETAKKSIAWAVHGIKKFQPYARALLRDYEVATFHGAPAKELSFRITGIPGGFQYRAFIDIVMRHRNTGQLVVFELKTTSMVRILDATYGNSAQALSYSLVLDKIAEGNSSYGVLYIIYKSKEEDFEFLEFQKSMLAKAKWLKTLLQDARRIEGCIEEDHFPMRGGSCVRFFRECKYYGSCEMSNRALLDNPTVLKKRVEEELSKEYTFDFTLEEIIHQQLS